MNESKVRLGCPLIQSLFAKKTRPSLKSSSNYQNTLDMELRYNQGATIVGEKETEVGMQENSTDHLPRDRSRHVAEDRSITVVHLPFSA